MTAENDRALLEAAARAAGRGGWTWDEDFQSMQSPAKATPSGPAHSYWNPLTDDGDALRLAVKLRMEVAIKGGSYVSVLDDEGREYDEYPHGDPYAATRRAIVRAAAAIGAAS